MRVVGIHGIGQTYVGPETLKQRWLPALRDGLYEAKWPHAQDVDLDIVGYGQLFRRGDLRDAGIPRIDPADLDDWERQMLTEWWREAAKLSAQSTGEELEESRRIQGPDFSGRARTPQVVQRALRQLTKSKFFNALGPERLLLLGLRQVKLFLHDHELKKAVLARVVERMSQDVGIIVGHSLGSVVAYEALCANPHWKVDTFVTLGSPIGIRNLVFDALTPAPRNGRGEWPCIRHWLNVADAGDIVALQKTLAPLFGAVEDHVVYNGWHSHDAVRYLSSSIVGTAIANALYK
jgi:hypothetical protein